MLHFQLNELNGLRNINIKYDAQRTFLVNRVIGKVIEVDDRSIKIKLPSKHLGAVLLIVISSIKRKPRILWVNFV